jgi:hypothetical protein
MSPEGLGAKRVRQGKAAGKAVSKVASATGCGGDLTGATMT